MELHEPIDQQKKLNIIAIADDSDFGRTALAYGKVLARIFKASLTVITNFGFALEEKIGGNILDINPKPDTDMEIEVRKDYFFPELLYSFAEKRNTIMFVIGVDSTGKQGVFNKRKTIQFIKPSRLPVMTVGSIAPTPEAFRHVVLPLDIERQAKEKALWAGYFSRFYQATIHILHPEYHDTGLKKQLADNLDFVEKLYHNLEIHYEVHSVPPPKNLDLYSIDFAPSIEATLTVVMMTRYRTLADLITGPRERKTIGNPGQFPVLCINQRDDLYVLCT